MKKIKIITPENIEVEYLLADVASRTAASLIDFLIQGIVTLILFIAILLISRYSNELWEDYYGWVIGIALLINTITTYSYFIVMELSMNGVTFGKKIMKLRTIRNNGQPLTLKHSAIRNLFRLFIDLFGVGVVLIFFTKERKRIGDFVASTIVIIEEDKTPPILLDGLLTKNQGISSYLSPEEQDLLRIYISRRDSIEDSNQLREALKSHFQERFKDFEGTNDYSDFMSYLKLD